MAHANPIRPNFPLLVSGVVSLGVALALIFVMDFGHPDNTFAALAILMVLTGVYGLVGIVVGLATVVPGHPKH